MLSTMVLVSFVVVASSLLFIFTIGIISGKIPPVARRRDHVDDLDM